MKRVLCTCALVVGLGLAIGSQPAALAQKAGGVLKVTHRDSPASMSIHEEGTYSVIAPMMGVFNNLVLYDQHAPQNSLATIRPELATEWTWDEDGTSLTFKLRKGVKWHDGKPFTAADVKCTWDLLAGRAQDRLRTNFRAAWYENLAEVTTNGDYEVTFRLKQRQPAFIALLASGYSPVCPGQGHARVSDRHGSVQVRRVQAKSRHQGCPQSQLLAVGQAVPRGYRMDHHTHSLDIDPWFCLREVRHDLSL